MKETLQRLYNKDLLKEKEAEQMMLNIGEGKLNQSEIASFLTSYKMRDVSVDELIGFQNALKQLSIKLDFSDFNIIDLCGTGGDGKNTINISTLASIIVAGANYKVAKHGNYGISSLSGSSTVMEYLGYKFKTDESKLQQELRYNNFCMLHAPLFHPALKNVAKVRKEMACKTIFNMLGPLVNPASPKNQLVGVYSIELSRLYKYYFEKSNSNYCIVHSLDGYDEVSLTDNFKLITKEKDVFTSPAEINCNTIHPSKLFGGETIKASAKIFTDILEGKGSHEQNQTVLINAAYAIKLLENKKSLNECLEIAQKSLLSGAALNTLKKSISK